MKSFTDTQLTICKLRYTKGFSKKKIGSLIGYSESDVTKEIKSILGKVGVTNELVVAYELLRANIIK